MAESLSPFPDNQHRQAQYDAMLTLLAPGERIGYQELLDRMNDADMRDATGQPLRWGMGMTLDDLEFRGYKELWRRSEIVSYREPYFDHEHEGNWTEGGLFVTRAEARDESLWA